MMRLSSSCVCLESEDLDSLQVNPATYDAAQKPRIRWFECVINITIQESTWLMNVIPPHRTLLLCINVLNWVWPAPDWKRPRGLPRRMWLQRLWNVREDFRAPVSSGASTHKYGANCDKSVKIWRNERYIILIILTLRYLHVYRFNFYKIQDGGQIIEKCHISACGWDESEILTATMMF